MPLAADAGSLLPLAADAGSLLPTAGSLLPLAADAGSLLPMAASLLAAGLVAGTMAGLLGIGGGIILVPALFHVFAFLGIAPDLRMHMAVATSLAVIAVTSVVSVLAHRKWDDVDMALLRQWTLPVFAGVACGVGFAAGVSGSVLSGIFAAMALVIAAHLAFSPPAWRLGAVLPGRPVRWATGLGIGALSSMMGVGGGIFGITFMTLFGRPMHQAVGTSSGLGLLIGLPGCIGFMIAGWGVPERPPFSLGYVNLVGFALITPATILTAPWGAKLGHRFSRRTLTTAFAVFLAITSARMFQEL